MATHVKKGDLVVVTAGNNRGETGEIITVDRKAMRVIVKGVNVPGWHLHFISKDRKLGGHILDFKAIGGALQIDTCNRFYMILPEQEQFSTLDLSQDRSKELEKVEK
jgi:ribosomal protein L24